MKVKIFALLWYLFITVSAEDVAVIIGGKEWYGPGVDRRIRYLNDAFIYTTHLPDKNTPCRATNEKPQIPDLPIAMYGFDAVFLPQYGIYICGGWNQDGEYLTHCYRYDPREGE